MAEWLVEEGIGEERAVLLKDGEIVAARLYWPGGLTVGQVEDAQVIALKPHGVWRKFGLVRFGNGEEAYARRMPRDITEGMRVRQEVTREAISERGRLKRAQSTHSEKDPTPAPSLASQLANDGADVAIVRAFPKDADWNEIFAEAWTGDVDFPGGSLIVSDTPAMTLIDVDLRDYPEALISNGIPAIARTLQRLQITGNIGIDFPTLDKGDRKVIDDRLGKCLTGWPHERTAMNGFGFVQIVAAQGQPSILQRIGRDRAGAAARLLLRRAEGLSGAGMLELSAHPAVLGRLTTDWLAELSRRTGKEVVMRPDPALALEASHAQLVTS